MARKKKPKSYDEAPTDPHHGGKIMEQDLEAQADKILAQDHMDLVAEVRKNTELIQQLFAAQQELIQPSNDPNYLKTLTDCKAQRDAIANQVSTVHIVPDCQEAWIGISVTNRKDQAAAIETARLMGEHLEAKVIRHD